MIYRIVESTYFITQPMLLSNKLTEKLLVQRTLIARNWRTNIPAVKQQTINTMNEISKTRITYVTTHNNCRTYSSEYIIS